MANIDDFLPTGKYLKAADIPEPVKVTISNVTIEQVGREQKTAVVIHFGNKLKPLIGNTTNLRTIRDAYGKDYDKWPGAEIVLFSTPVDYQGRPTDGIRVRIPKHSPAPTTFVPNARQRAEMATADKLDDDLPPF